MREIAVVDEQNIYIIYFSSTKTLSRSDLEWLIEGTGRLWSIYGSEVIVLSGLNVHSFTSLISLKCIDKGIYVKSLLKINPREVTVERVIDDGIYNPQPARLISEFKGVKVVQARSRTPLVASSLSDVVGLLAYPSNSLLSLNLKDSILSLTITRKSCDEEYGYYVWKATYKLSYDQALKLAIIGRLGIGLEVERGYGRFDISL